MSRITYLLSLAICACLALEVSSAEAPKTSVDPTRFEATVLATGLMRPMDLALAPDGAVYFIEYDGKLKVLDPKSKAITLVGEVKVTTEQENGLIGLALDPHFAENHWVFLHYSPPDYPGQYVSRFTLKEGKLDLSSEKLLVKYEEQRKECCHHAGSIQFGPRGELFITAGDNTHPFGASQSYAPLDERPGREPFDAQKSASNTNSGAGKILRIKPTPEGTCEIPEGNLFPRDGSQGRPDIYVMGCRNPWRMTVDQATGFVYWGEVGPDAQGDGPRGPRGYDEINQARKAGNFGWPYFIANNRAYAHVDFATGKIGPKYDPQHPVNTSPNNTGAKELPPAQPALIYYPYGASAEFPELGSGGRTACAGPVYHYSAELKSEVKFPAAYDRALFIYEWTRNWIKVVHLNEQYNVDRIEPFMPGHHFVRPIDMEFGPDGALYVIEYGDSWGVNKNAQIIRIDYYGANRPPVVMAAAEHNIGKAPLAVSLSSKGTLDRDAGDKLTYEWRATRAAPPNGPKTEVAPEIVSRDPNPTVTFAKPGIYNVELVVTDTHGAQRSASVPVLVGNERPQVRFLSPHDGDFYDPTQPIHYRLYVNDAEDGTNDAAEAEKAGLEELDSTAVARLSLNAQFSSAPLPAANGAAAAADEGPPGMRLMKRSDCFNCHAVDQPRVGPPLLEVANKYRGKKDALEASVERVLKGSSGVWGKVPMIPHAQHSPEDVREMVGWVYSLEPNGLVRVFNGFVGEIPTAIDTAAGSGHFKLEATYLDRGAGEIPAQSATTTIYLRPRLVEAESADEVHGPLLLKSKTASGGTFAGSINHGQYLRFNGVTLDQVRQLTLRVASAGAGGEIEVRLDKPDGPIIATAKVEVNGQWENWYERTIDVAPTTGRHDLFVRFVNPKNASALMNLDSILFHQ